MLLEQQHCEERMIQIRQLLNLQEEQQKNLMQTQMTHSTDARFMGRSLELEKAWTTAVNEMMIMNQAHVHMMDAVRKQQEYQPRQRLNYMEDFVSMRADNEHNTSHVVAHKQQEYQSRKDFHDMDAFVSKQASSRNANRQHDTSHCVSDAHNVRLAKPEYDADRSALSTVSDGLSEEALFDTLSGGGLETNLSATTLMVRNIPIRYTQEMLLKEWPNNGEYDLLYLPIHIKKRCNNSFCFINFLTPQAAQDFAAKWQNRKLQAYSSRKPLDISLAVVQGFHENLMRCKCNKTMRLNNVHFLPAVFEGSRRIDVRALLEVMKRDEEVEQQLKQKQKHKAEL